MLKVPYVPFKHRYLDLNQVTFWNGQEKGNEFKVTYEPLKHRFLDFTKVAFRSP